MTEREQTIAYQLLKEIGARLGLPRRRRARLPDPRPDQLTLSGGEAQRIRLATQIGSTLMGVLYILDEPTIGLHQRDNAKLIATLTRLRDLGNTLLVVEHDEETIRTADWVIDIGPGAGEHGGEIIASGPLEALLAEPRSITGAFLRGERAVPIPAERRTGSGKSLVVKGAREHNLQDLDVDVPARHVHGRHRRLGLRQDHPRDRGPVPRPRPRAERVARAAGRPRLASRASSTSTRSSRSTRARSAGRRARNPATYTGLFGPIRELFAGVPEARVRGYGPGRFSFNVKGGRCENCKGDGIIKIEMQFLPDVYVPCEVCDGRRYNREALEIHYRGRSIADVLEMTVEEALEVFRPVPTVATKLQTLNDVGLGYIRLGQPATTLSGGEAQRVKLSTELSRRATGRTVYVLDEPTTGLHFADVEKLLQVLHRLVDTGNTVIVIEHNLDVIKTADWIIDLGPGGWRSGRPDHRRGHARGGRRDEGLGDRRVPRPRAARRAARAALRRHVRRGGRSRRATNGNGRRAAMGPAGVGRPASGRARGGDRRLTGATDTAMPEIDFAFLADAAETVPARSSMSSVVASARIGGRTFPLRQPHTLWSSA